MLSIAVIRKVMIYLLRDGMGFAEYLGPPPRRWLLGFRRAEWWAGEPDHPPSTCCVRVVRLGCWDPGWLSVICGHGAGRGSWSDSGVIIRMSVAEAR